jgi:hypothetical protein
MVPSVSDSVLPTACGGEVREAARGTSACALRPPQAASTSAWRGRFALSDDRHFSGALPLLVLEEQPLLGAAGPPSEARSGAVAWPMRPFILQPAALSNT